ncbi:hypothetical protein [Natrinema altunense]|uniref:Uncharacterized protein n=1 Tax=Natrinema altunense TaxID=222984 RepID=A0A482XVD5_9EURY|nr:hypothetical protein [Natrinema altunense]RZH66842.1 hypothetical protein ELS17_13770 [Natrinema altunense]
MSETPTAADRPTTVQWKRLPHGEFPAPIIARLPYAELKLEHPDLEPTGYGESFFPDAVPYASGDAHRIFYWRSVLRGKAGDVGSPATWEGICATPTTLEIVPTSESNAFDLVSSRETATAVTVDATVAGESTTALLESYTAPTVRVLELTGSRLRLVADGTEYTVRTGTRRRISLPERMVERADGGGGSTTTTPELVVRVPGERELHHPALGADYRLFPSFGMNLETVPNPLPVPTTNDELDHEALAESLSLDLSARPYPERVLWQAIATTAFDLHARPESVPRLCQFPTGHVGLSVDRDAGE